MMYSNKGLSIRWALPLTSPKGAYNLISYVLQS